MEIPGSTADIHMRIDAGNLGTTASTTHLLDQQETIHMVHMLGMEARSGAMMDFATRLFSLSQWSKRIIGHRREGI